MALGQLPQDNFHLSLEWMNEWMVMKIQSNHEIITWLDSFSSIILIKCAIGII